jgi:hypothetical protein
LHPEGVLSGPGLKSLDVFPQYLWGVAPLIPDPNRYEFSVFLQRTEGGISEPEDQRNVIRSQKKFEDVVTNCDAITRNDDVARPGQLGASVGARLGIFGFLMRSGFLFHGLPPGET